MKIKEKGKKKRKKPALQNKILKYTKSKAKFSLLGAFLGFIC